MYSPYKRRPSLVRTLWIYRWLVALACVLGLLLWFIVINSTPVTVYFPLRLGQITSTSGIVVLLGAFGGAAVTGLTMMLLVAIRRHREAASSSGGDLGRELPDDKPPADYATKTPEGFSDAHWSAR